MNKLFKNIKGVGQNFKQAWTVLAKQKKLAKTERILSIFEKKRKQIEKEQDYFPTKLEKIQKSIFQQRKKSEVDLIKKQQKLQSNYEKQLKKARLEEHRRIIRLKKAEIALRAKENFVRRGGTKVTWSAFRDIDQKLKIKFSWYEKWHLNPISPKVHSFALASYLVLISFVTANLIEWPSASKAKNIGERKSAVISEITDGNIFSNIQNSERVLSSTTAKVTFAPTGQDAKVEIQAKPQDNTKAKAINFTVLQPSNLVDQSVSEGEKNLSFKSRLINLFSKAEAQEPDEAISTTPESALISPTAAATSSATVSPNASPTVEPNQKSVKAAKTESISKKDNLTTVKVNDYLDLQYEFVSSPSQTKLKETAVIKDKAALVLDQQYNLAFNFDFGDLIAEEQTDNSFLLKDSAGQTIMQIAAPTIWDANKTAGKVKLALDNTAKQAIYRIDSSFVDSAKFPLYLDPTVTIDSNVTTTNPNSYAKDKTLFQTTDGTLIKIYSDGSSLYYRTSTDTGSNWSSSTKILDSATVDDNGFSGWIDPFNNIHLAYSHNGTDSYIFYRKISYSYSDGTISVGSEQTVESGGTSQMYPSVSATETGTTYVAYRYYDGSNYSIKVKSYDGSSWSDSLQTATNADSGVYPVLINWDDRPALIYKEANSIKWNYYAGAWKANGWTNESITSEVDSDTGLEFSAIESVDNNYLHLTWRGSGTKGILYKQNANAEAGWDANATEITSDHNDRYPSIGANKNNLVQIYFTDNNGSNNDVKYVQKVSTGGFASAVSVTTDGGNNIYPSALQSALFARNNMVTFDGTDDYVDMPDDFANFTNGLTFELWAYPTAAQNWGRFVDLGNGAPNNNILFGRNGTTTTLLYVVCNGTATCPANVYATNALELNKWQHFVVTESAAGAVTIYKNGVSIATGTQNVPNNATRTNNYLGRSAYSVDSYYKGNMDGVRIYNRAITSSEVTAHYQSGLGPSRFASDTNLLAGYNFDEASGTSTTDVSGNGYTATLTNGVTRSANTMPYKNSGNYATTHNDSASYINVPAASSTNLDTTLTMSAWVRVNSDTGWHWIIGKAGGDWLGLTTGGYLNFSIAGGTDRTSTTAYVMDDNWHHVAATVTGGTIKLYLDGYNTDTWTGQTLTAKTGATYIGYNGYEYFNGAINEARLYTTALSDAQILAQFQAGLFATGAPESGLAGGWSMNEGSGTTLADFSGNSNTGSVVGTITFENIIKNTSNNVPASFISGSSSPYALKFAPKAKTWIGGTDDKWSTAANWSDSTVPAAGDYVYLTNSGTIIADSVADAIDTIEVSSGGGIYFNKHPSLNADTFKINLTGSLIINGTMQSEGDATVSHDGVNDGQGNQFAAANIIIGSSATIDLEGLGFTAQKGPGKSTSTAIGASHGGEGYGAASSTVYGDYSNPVSLGSGGTAGRGGGAIILTATGTADLSGTISANGQTIVNNSGGSGGSVNITAGTITGNGTVTANGGTGVYANFIGSSGGRIKLAADSISSSLTLQAQGGKISPYYGSAGTIYKKTTAQTYGDLIIDNGDNVPAIYHQYAAHLKTSADTGSYQFDNITFANYGLLAVDAGQTLALNSGTITGDKNSGVVNAGTVTVPDSWTLNHMYSDKGGTITNASSKSLTISSTGRLTHYQNNDQETYKLNLTLASLTVQSSGEINADYVGYSTQNGPGKSTSAYIGASYGGEGYGAASSTVYGDYSNPVNLGSGGTAGRGGGAIILTVTGTADLSGTISANGQSGGWNQSNGSGGSVNITAATITGNGTVTANGGSTSNRSGVGGGGRIKLAADSISSSLTLQAQGGKYGTYYGSAGTIYKKTTAQTYGDLIVDNGDNTPGLNAQKMAHLKTSADTGSYQFDNITFANYGLLAVDASQTLALNSGTITGDKNSGVVNAGTVTVPDSWTLSHMYSNMNGTITNASSKSLTISSTGRLTHYQNNDQETYKLNLTLASLTVQSGGEINADYVGYAAQNGPGKSTSAYIGASYGGEGYGAANTTAYGDYSNPVNLGSGGTAGRGGGAIILTVTGTADLSGTISANGQSGGWYQSDGSGGSVNITAASITGNGTVTTDGGTSQTYNGVASGGRIKLAADSISSSLTLQAKGGKYGTYYGSAGTIYKKTTAQTYGDLIIDNSTNTPALYDQYAAHLKTSADTGSYQFDNITFANYGLLAVDAGQTLSLSSGTITGDKNSGVVNAGTVTVPDSWTLGYMYSNMNGTITNLADKAVTISSTGRLTHYPNTTAETYKLNWTVSALTVQSGGEINADSLGYSPQYGPGKSTSKDIGASYGGEGYGAASSTVYGDYSNPVNIGSGGSNGRGGGAIILTVTGTADLSGTISAEGLSGGWYTSDGSGGSVNITAASITGNGTITANGGTGQTYAGVAGGGRIKLAADSISSSLTVQAKGGKYGGYYGSAGTIYKKTTAQTYGDLIIDNSTNTPATRTARVPLTLPLSFDNLTVTNYASLEISTNADPAQNNFAVSNDLVVAANSELQLLTDRDGTPASGAWPIMTVGNNATVSGTISATGAGFTYNSGPGAGKISGSYGSGGGYGGAGGASSNGATGGATYGSQTDNNYLGSGGGYTTGGSGGGMIKLTVAGTLDLSSTGSLTANGNGGTAGGGGGSGGSIQLVAGTLSGTAGSSITVNGGGGGSNGGGGGGGRITIYPANDSYSGIKTATGGAAGTSAVAGSDGTVFVQHSPSSLTMNAPNDAATGQIQKTVFRINSTDVEGDWIQYKLQVATDSSFTQNVSTFDQTSSQNPTDGGRTAIFSNQDKTTGNVAGTDGYSSGREAILTMQTNLTQGTTYYWRFYGYDPEGVDSFDGTKHWSNASATRSFTIAAIDHVSFSTAQQDIVVTFCSAVMTVNLRDSANNEIYLTNDDGAKTINLATTSETGAFYSDGSCQNTISNNNLNIAVDGNSASFYYKDTTPSAVNSFWNITAAESPSAGWTDASQNIRVRPGDFGSLEISIAGSLTQVTAGVAFSTPANDVTVTAKDIFGNVKSDWTGQVWFYSSDSQAAFTYNDSNRYTFTSGDGSDNGTHTFIGSGFVFKTKGSQSLVVHNSVDSQYDAITDITVLCAGADHFSLGDYPRTASNKFAMSSFAWDVSGYSSAPYSPAASVYDAYNNLIDNFTGEVWFELYKANDTPGNPLNSTADYAFDYDHTNHYTFTTGEGTDNGTHTFDGSGFTVVTAANDLRLRVATTANSGKYTDFTITVKPQAIDHFTLTASPTLSLNGTDWEKANDTAFTESVILTAYDAFGNVKTDYAYDASSKSGMVYFSSSDTLATLPYTKSSLNDTSKCFNFPAESAGSYTFTPENTPTDYFKFLSGGPQTISVSECIDPTSTYYETRYDPKFESNNPLKTIASTGQLPAANSTPSKVYVSQHIPGSTHTAADHTNNSNDLVEAAPGHQQATLSWYNPFDFPIDANIDAQVYIYRCQTDCDNNANFSKLTTDPAKVTAAPSTWSEYTDTGLANDNLYYYKLAYAYLKQDSTYMVSDYSATVSVTPADIAPREVTADQLDLSENATAAGKVKIDYKLRWTSTVSIAYFNPTTNTWKDASSAAQSGDIGANITGNETPISHVAYFDPRIDFPNQNLTESFKVRIKVVVNSAHAYSDSSAINLDSGAPTGTSLIINASDATLTLHLTASDTSSPITMMISNTDQFTSASWQAFNTTVSSYDAGDAEAVYIKLRDNYNNIVSLSKEILPTVENVQIKDASNSNTSEYRLAIIWSAVSINNFKQYKIYRATDGKTFSLLGNADQNGYLDMNLAVGTNYSYKVATEDTDGNISRVSTVVTSSPGTAPDVTSPPSVELFGWKQDVGVRAKITWHTDQLSDSFVAYSTEPLLEGSSLATASGQEDTVKVVGLPDMKSDHEVTLYNLDPSVKYYYKVLSKNEIQITGYSQVFDFTTPERILLLISGTNFSDITNNSAIVSWTTSKLSTTVVEYGQTTNYDQEIVDTTLNTEHKFQLQNLNAGQYHLRIKATDTDGNTTISDDYVFEIPPAPVISDVTISEVGETTAKVSWKTNIEANSNVDFGESTQYGGSQGSAQMTTDHIVTLIGLSPKTVYHISARSIDKFGNVANGSDMTFTTTADTEAPQILNAKSEITSTGTGENVKFQLIVSWETNEPATSKVEYGAGMGDAYDSSSKEDLSLNVTHTIIVNDLRPNSLYHFRIKSADRANNTAYSDDYTFTTPQREKNILVIIYNAVAGPFVQIWQGVVNRFK